MDGPNPVGHALILALNPIPAGPHLRGKIPPLFICAALLAACGGVSARSGTDSGSGGTAGGGTTGSGGSVTSSGGSNVTISGGGNISGSTGGPCDPQLIGAAVIDREHERLSWVDAYLNGEVSLYRGPWSADHVISGGGIEPQSTHVAFENALGTFMRNAEAVFLEFLYPDLPTPGFLLIQPFARPGTTRFILYTDPSDWMRVERECEGCLVDFGSQPNVVTADTLVLGQGSGDEVTLNMEFRRVPPAALTGEALLAFGDGRVWRLESGQWVAAACENYTGSGRPFPSAWYRVDYFIDDANPRAHGVKAITVLTCDETCLSPDYEGDYCPPLPDPAACR